MACEHMQGLARPVDDSVPLFRNHLPGVPNLYSIHIFLRGCYQDCIGKAFVIGSGDRPFNEMSHIYWRVIGIGRLALYLSLIPYL